MARAVTGALRAVKVVRRVDFEMERTFEREFEGIRSFEPISRSHPGFIDILHVGRNADEGFYFCVMELADDRYACRAIVPAEYEPRTLSTDKKDSANLGLDKVIEVGLLLADALAHLHQHGLIHRDVKPSNVIFINGAAQLADIGLVAAYGQRTYVGTEGFVPPEGPGTPQADTYSLGMVLYELSTGKDRLEFPALPDDLDRLGERKKWWALNEIICRACSPDPKDRYPNAHEMAEDLRRVLHGGRKKQRRWWHRKRVWLGAAAAFVCLVWADQVNKRAGRSAGAGVPVAADSGGDVPEEFPFVGPPAPPPPKVGLLQLRTDPPGAEVWIEETFRGHTPIDLDEWPVGTVPVTFRLPRHREVTHLVPVVEGEPDGLQFGLDFWDPPAIGEKWRNSFGLEFEPRGAEHVALLPTTVDHFVQAHDGEFREGEVLSWTPPGGSSDILIVFVPQGDAETYCAWMAERDREHGFFGIDHFYRFEKVEEGVHPTKDDSIREPIQTGDREPLSFRLVVGQHQFGTVLVTSTPSGAEVFEDGTLLGSTPLTLERRLAGPVAFDVQLPGHLPGRIEGEVHPSKPFERAVTLERTMLAVFDQDWQNGLGQIFRPVDGLQFCIWETRVRDYDEFLKAKGRTHTTDIDQTPEHPVVGVTRADAIAFCQWLTEKEIAEGRLEKTWAYRLPTDTEWSAAVGIRNERGSTPRQRNSVIKGVYPWGYKWPPPPKAGNFADRSAQGKFLLDRPGDRLLPGRDGFDFTAPVGLFDPGDTGLHDLAGNVWEWVADDFGEEADRTTNYSTFGVVRGGSWADYSKERLFSSFRNAVPVAQVESNTGFRIVLDGANGQEPKGGGQKYGAVFLTSTPTGAEVFENGERLGSTPLTLERRPAGPVAFDVRLPGYQPARIEGEIQPSTRFERAATLERAMLAVFDQEWQNGLGQIFRPVGGLQFCIWETRVRDFDEFLKATGRTHTADIDQTPDYPLHPVVGVKRADAMAFCQWLTEKETAEGRLEKGWTYRLPADIEWSAAAGIPNERGSTPRARNSVVKGIFPWGYDWPPPPKAGNFADQSALGKFTLDRPRDRLLPGRDGYHFTAPVGKFDPGATGLYDLAGNVWEWVADDFGGEATTINYSTFGVVRGGSWADYKKDRLFSSFRNAVPIAQIESNIGFRIVLDRAQGQAQKGGGRR